MVDFPEPGEPRSQNNGGLESELTQSRIVRSAGT